MGVRRPLGPREPLSGRSRPRMWPRPARKQILGGTSSLQTTLFKQALRGLLAYLSTHAAPHDPAARNRMHDCRKCTPRVPGAADRNGSEPGTVRLKAHERVVRCFAQRLSHANVRHGGRSRRKPVHVSRKSLQGRQFTIARCASWPSAAAAAQPASWMAGTRRRYARPRRECSWARAHRR